MENILKYSRPARYFTEALVLGNGTMGAAVYSDPACEKISFNHDTLWSGRPGSHTNDRAYEAYETAKALIGEGKHSEGQRAIEDGFHSDWSQAFLPMGTLLIQSFGNDYHGYTRTLDMESAIASASYQSDLGHTVREYFVSAPDKCFASHFTTDQRASYKLTAECLLKHKIEYQEDTLILSGQAPIHIFPRGHVPEGVEQIQYGDGSITFTLACRVLTDGEIISDIDGLSVRNATKLTVLACAETSFLSFEKAPTKEHRVPALDGIARAAAKGYEALRRAHAADFASYYNRVRLDLCSEECALDTDERLKAKEKDLGLYELIFNFGRYLTISASREGSQATHLQGIWNEQIIPPWQSNYTVNINTEMNYWPTLPCNLTEFYEPLVAFIQKIRVTGRSVARDFYHADGFVSHHNVDLWGMANPVGKNTRGSAVYAFWGLSSGWLCLHLYERYEYTLDREFLASTAYPIMKEAASFYLSIITKEKDGSYILTPTTSPENCFLKDGEKLAVTRYTTMSQSIVKNLFENCLRAAGVLGIQDEFTEQIKTVAEGMHLFSIGKRGELLEWDTEYEESEPHHRHVSHLIGLYPGTLITTESAPDIADAIRKSLLLRGDNGTGWSLAWKVNLWAKLKDGDHALRLVDLQLAHVAPEVDATWMGGGTYPNLLGAHPPFQIDGNFGVTSGIALMLLQCEDEKLKLLPALPARFPSGSVKGLLAKGNITVDLSWNHYELTELTLTSPISQNVVISIGNRKESFTFSIRAGEPKTVIEQGNII